MDRATLKLQERVQRLEAALRLMYEGYAAEYHFRTEVGLGAEEIEFMQQRACDAVSGVMPELVAEYRQPDQWLNIEDDNAERQIAWFGEG